MSRSPQSMLEMPAQPIAAAPGRPGEPSSPWGQPGRIVAFVVIGLVLMLMGSPGVALACGVAVALTVGNPLRASGAKFAKKLLQGCVVLLGFSMDLHKIVQAGVHGCLFAAVTIATTLLVGYWVGRLLKMNQKTSALICAGTAICGGSAIAAVGSVLAVTEGEIAVAMGTVFLLNGVALYLFPVLGHALHLTQGQFGTWAGVAIHDISSVVGASSTYGVQALETATAVKLSRTLWIVPVALGMALAFRRENRRDNQMGSAAPSARPSRLKLDVPWFIGLFLLASLGRSFMPLGAVTVLSPMVTHVAKAGLALVLFLIGASLSMNTLRAVGWRSAVQGIVLWAFISVASLLGILGYLRQ